LVLFDAKVRKKLIPAKKKRLQKCASSDCKLLQSNSAAIYTA
jgi:hypothetical protein